MAVQQEKRQQQSGPRMIQFAKSVGLGSTLRLRLVGLHACFARLGLLVCYRALRMFGIARNAQQEKRQQQSGPRMIQFAKSVKLDHTQLQEVQSV